MHFRKLVSLWALLALMFGQVALAHHSATHIDHRISYESASTYNDEHNDQEESTKHQCPECVLTKSLQTAFYNATATLFYASQAEVLLPQEYSFATVVNRYNSNSPRAPPAILI